MATIILARDVREHTQLSRCQYTVRQGDAFVHNLEGIFVIAIQFMLLGLCSLEALCFWNMQAISIFIMPQCSASIGMFAASSVNDTDTPVAFAEPIHLL